jgi:hypothetical protein
MCNARKIVKKYLTKQYQNNTIFSKENFMTSDQEKTLKLLVKDAKENDDIIGLILCGSLAKTMEIQIQMLIYL